MQAITIAFLVATAMVAVYAEDGPMATCFGKYSVTPEQLGEVKEGGDEKVIHDVASAIGCASLLCKEVPDHEDCAMMGKASDAAKECVETARELADDFKVGIQVLSECMKL